MTPDEIKIQNSQQINVAALAVLALWGTLLTVVLEYRIPKTGFWVCFGLSVIAVVVSYLLSGWAANRLRSNQGGVSFFNLQAIACLFSFVVALPSFCFLGALKTDDVADELNKLQQEVGALKHRAMGLESSSAKRDEDANAMSGRINELSAQLLELRNQSEATNPPRKRKEKKQEK